MEWIASYFWIYFQEKKRQKKEQKRELQKEYFLPPVTPGSPILP